MRSIGLSQSNSITRQEHFLAVRILQIKIIIHNARIRRIDKVYKPLNHYH